eukprot:TRINITY_DN11598_c0_g1_i1.p4 TRINITY_DN11598_c0_g1~~TRINITY_DN11598_c0_g1_i1.p4  ORF type:complete len:172 (-),score=27.02 TRINITY_DN11598_c0_g1_i1:290-805(-)
MQDQNKGTQQIASQSQLETPQTKMPEYNIADIARDSNAELLQPQFESVRESQDNLSSQRLSNQVQQDCMLQVQDGGECQGQDQMIALLGSGPRQNQMQGKDGEMRQDTQLQQSYEQPENADQEIVLQSLQNVKRFIESNQDKFGNIDFNYLDIVSQQIQQMGQQGNTSTSS